MQIPNHQPETNKKQAVLFIMPLDHTCYVSVLNVKQGNIDCLWTSECDGGSFKSIITQTKILLDEKSIKHPKSVIIASEKVLSTIVNIPGKDISLDVEQIKNMLQWEMEPMVTQRILINRLGSELVTEGLLTSEQVRSILARQQKLKADAQLSGEYNEKNFRFGQIAINMGYLQANELNHFLQTHQEDVSGDMTIASGWQVLNNQNNQIIASAMLASKLNNWKQECQSEGMQLIAAISTCHLLATTLLQDSNYSQAQVTTNRTRFTLRCGQAPEYLQQQPLVDLQAQQNENHTHFNADASEQLHLQLCIDHISLVQPSGQSEKLSQQQTNDLMNNAARLAALEVCQHKTKHLACVVTQPKKQPIYQHPTFALVAVIILLLIAITCPEIWLRLQYEDQSDQLKKAKSSYRISQSTLEKTDAMKITLEKNQKLLKEQEAQIELMATQLDHHRKDIATHDHIISLLNTLKKAVNEHQIVLDYIGRENDQLTIKGWATNEIDGRKLIQIMTNPAQASGFDLSQTSITHQPQGRLGPTSHELVIHFTTQENNKLALKDNAE